MQLKVVITGVKGKARGVGNPISSFMLWSGRWWYPTGVC